MKTGRASRSPAPNHELSGRAAAQQLSGSTGGQRSWRCPGAPPLLYAPQATDFAQQLGSPRGRGSPEAPRGNSAAKRSPGRRQGLSRERRTPRLTPPAIISRSAARQGFPRPAGAPERQPAGAEAPRGKRRSRRPGCQPCRVGTGRGPGPYGSRPAQASRSRRTMCRG